MIVVSIPLPSHATKAAGAMSHCRDSVAGVLFISLISVPVMAIPLHPAYGLVQSELHARPLVLTPAASRIRRVVVLMPALPGAVTTLMDRLSGFLTSLNVEVGASRQASFEVGGLFVTWEIHTEFVTVTWTTSLDDWEISPQGIGLELLGEGQMVGATRIDVMADAQIPPALFDGFSANSLCFSRLDNGKAEVATDFVPDADGFTRFEFAAKNLTDLNRSLVVRRLLDIETYRTVALLGLPLAHQLSPALRQAEIELSGILADLGSFAPGADATATLDKLRELSARAGQLLERSTYRFAASNAYGEILRKRLDSLAEQGTELGHTLHRFVNDRVEPALATCRATERRLGLLADKVDRASHLLDVHIGLQIQTQTASVLDKIANTAHSQFLLQRTVEGLSTIAISYYLLGILGYLLAAPMAELHVDKVLAMSVAAPIVVFVVWLLVRRIRRTHV
jgi:uncharacterized membrane-anchored protein